MKKSVTISLAALASVMMAASGSGAKPLPAAPVTRRAAPQGGDPLKMMFASMHLSRNAHVAALTYRGSCEAGELAAMMSIAHVTSIERDDLKGPVDGVACPTSASIVPALWPSSETATMPIHGLDLLWIAGSYHQLYASLSASWMTILMRSFAGAVAPTGALVIVDGLPASDADPLAAARAGRMNPQLVLDQAEAAGFRLQSFANNAHPGADGAAATPATRFVMVFKLRTRDGSRVR